MEEQLKKSEEAARKLETEIQEIKAHQKAHDPKQNGTRTRRGLQTPEEDQTNL
jgi:hypothetical protein